jgi:hypothetical protein
MDVPSVAVRIDARSGAGKAPIMRKVAPHRTATEAAQGDGWEQIFIDLTD